MQYALLGSTGLLVSRLSFGAMTFTGGNASHAAIYKVGKSLAEELVSRCLDAGVNYFDTSDNYADGESETLLGSVLAARRNDVVITTKVGFRSGKALVRAGLTRRHILWSVDQSLKRLGTDWIDAYVVHREDPHTPLEETVAALDAVVRAGKVRYIGFSNWSAWRAAAAIELQRANGLAQFTHGQMHYSLVGRDIERDVVPMLARYGAGLTVWSPLASGFLTGKYTRDTLKDPQFRLSGFDLLPFDKERGFALVEEMRVIAERRRASVAQVALAWLLARPAVTSVILGAAKRSQLDDNLGAIDVHLGDEDIAALDAATALPPVYPHWFSERLVDAATETALQAS